MLHVRVHILGDSTVCIWEPGAVEPTSQHTLVFNGTKGECLEILMDETMVRHLHEVLGGFLNEASKKQVKASKIAALQEQIDNLKGT